MDLEPIKYSGPELFGNAMHVFLDMIFLFINMNGYITSPNLLILS